MKANELIQNWYKAQLAGAVLPCPRCGREMDETLSHNSFSRRADVYVCSHCGMEEAIEDMKHNRISDKKISISQWFVSSALLSTPEVYKYDESSYQIKVKRTIILTNENIDDIMCAALEGGITSWCTSAEVVENEYLGEFAHEQISRGGSLKLYDAEEDKTYILTLEKLLKGFTLACANGWGDRGEWFDKDNGIDTCMIDALDADAIVQCALFGEVVYG